MAPPRHPVAAAAEEPPFKLLTGPNIASAAYLVNQLGPDKPRITISDVRMRVTGRGGQAASEVIQLLETYGRIVKETVDAGGSPSEAAAAPSYRCVDVFTVDCMR